MPQAIGAYVADAYAFNVIGATVATATAIETAVTIIATIALNQVVSAALAPSASTGQGGTTASQLLATTVRQAAAQRRLIFGQVKAGGVLAYPSQIGSYIDYAIILGEGPLQGIDSVIWVGDELSSDPKFSGLVEVTFYDGGPGQVASADLIAASGGEWTSAHVGNGLAWMHVRYKHNRTAFPRGRTNAWPAALTQGLLCYDPRTGLTAWTANAALVILYYIRCEYGPNGGVPDDLIDFDHWATQANICDELVDSIDPANIVDGVPGKVRRYEINGVFEVGGGHTQTLQTMVQACAGNLVMDGEKYRLYVGAWRAPTGPVLTSEYLRDGVEFQTHPTRQQRINTVRGTYREPRQDWQTIDYREQQDAAAVIDEDGEIVQAINFPVTTNGATAQRLAWLSMQSARSLVPLSLRCNWAAFQWKLYDTITVNVPEADAVGVYRIDAYDLPDSGGVDLVLTPHSVEQFAWNPATMESLVPTVVRPDFATTPEPITSLVVTGGTVLVDGYIETYGIRAAWDDTTAIDPYFKHYEYQRKETASSAWVGGIVTTAGISITLTTGVEYDFRVRLVRLNNTASAWATETNITVSGDTTPPGVPTGLSVTGTTTHTISWTNPSATDFLRSRIYANEVSADAGTAVEVDEVFGFPSTAYSAENTPAAVPAWYWVTSVDRNGNESARTYAGTAS